MSRLPPTIFELLEIPDFLSMMRMRPNLPKGLRSGTPWRLWAQLDNGRWLTKEYEDYADVWKKAVHLMKVDNVEDVSIVSKRYLTAPPKRLERALRDSGIARGFTWCPRCRRPSYFGAYTEKHHALKLQPTLTEDDPFRCFYCGIRRAMTRSYA